MTDAVWLQRLKAKFSTEFTPNLHSIDTCAHFTNLKSAQSIIANKTMWLTPVGTSNDDSELFFGHQIVLEEVSGLLAGKERDRILERLAKLQWGFFAVSFCRTSFNEIGNNVAFWLEYGNRGDGVCLEVKFHELYNMANDQIGQAIAFPMIYDSDVFREKLRIFIGLAVELVAAESDEGEKEKILDLLGNMLLNIRTVCKHSCFSFENEIKIAVIDPDSRSLHSQDREKDVLIYAKVDLSIDRGDLLDGQFWPRKTPIVRAMVGPSPQQNRAQRLVQTAFLKSETAYYQNRVEKTSIPYRAR